MDFDMISPEHKYTKRQLAEMYNDAIAHIWWLQELLAETQAEVEVLRENYEGLCCDPD